jgi:hypothetical protein
MNVLRLVFVVDAFIAAIFGIALLAAPALLVGLYGIVLDTSATVALARLFGAFVLGQAVMLWAARDQTQSAAGLAITRGHAVVDVTAVIVLTEATASHALNPMGWSMVALFVVLGAVRVYYSFSRPTASAAAGVGSNIA